MYSSRPVFVFHVFACQGDGIISCSVVITARIASGSMVAHSVANAAGFFTGGILSQLAIGFWIVAPPPTCPCQVETPLVAEPTGAAEEVAVLDAVPPAEEPAPVDPAPEASLPGAVPLIQGFVGHLVAGGLVQLSRLAWIALPRFRSRDGPRGGSRRAAPPRRGGGLVVE